ncbi:MAG: N-glycosylase/DNA lyase [Termitinemataceae bacterium]|nr:MAG: N-glycosylase/DNA lyase [Termitinemataceae bacterium]
MLDLHKLYKTIKIDIDDRLAQFRKLYDCGSHKDIFKEMCFCTCTPQNNAQKAWGAVQILDREGALLSGEATDIAVILRSNGVRFHQNKARYIVANRENFYPNTKKIIKQILDSKTQLDARNYLEKNVVGWGLKEASHFLRNIGFGNEISILDRHILRQLVLYKVIDEVPSSITKKIYLETENLMSSFCKKEQIPLDAMDLLFWYKEKNELFK